MGTSYLLMSGGKASLGNFLNGIVSSMSLYGKIIIVIIGLAMVLVGVFQIAKNLISHGKGQTNWFVTIALIVVGGVFSLTGGWAFIGGIAQGSSESLQGLAENGKPSENVKPTDPWQDTGTNNGGGTTS